MTMTTINDIASSCLRTIPTCPIILEGLAACSAAIDCPHRAECAEREKALDVVLEKIARGEI